MESALASFAKITQSFGTEATENQANFMTERLKTAQTETKFLLLS